MVSTLNPITKYYKDGFHVELVEYYPKLIEWYQNSEIETQDWCIDHFQKDWVAFDIGAHIGYYSLLFNHLAPNGKVYAFEPNAKSRTMMASNFSHNHGRMGVGTLNIHVIPTAVGDKTGRFHETLWLTDGEDTWGKTDGDFHFVRLDDFAWRMVDRLDFIKCDADGWDFEVLVGAQETIKTFRPVIVAEINYALQWRNHTGKEVEDLLASLNYTHKVIDPCPNHWLCWPKE